MTVKSLYFHHMLFFQEIQPVLLNTISIAVIFYFIQINSDLNAITIAIDVAILSCHTMIFSFSHVTIQTALCIVDIPPT